MATNQPTGGLTITDWLNQQGYQQSGDFNGGITEYDPYGGHNLGAQWSADQDTWVGGEPFNFDYTKLPGYEGFMTAETRGQEGEYIPGQFQLAEYLKANPQYRARHGNLGGRAGTVQWIEDANGRLVGSPNWNRNTAVADRNAMIAVIAGGYFGGSAAFGGGGEGAAAAEMSGLGSNAGYDTAVIGGEGATTAQLGGEATAGTAGAEATTTASDGAAFNENGFNGHEPTNPSFAQSGNGYGGYSPNGTQTNGGYNWDQLIRGGLGLWQAYRLDRNSRDGGTSPASRAANEELTRLLEDPSKITAYPGYKAGLQAVQRAGAGGGYLGSGNMMTALQDYGGEFYDRALSRLAGIAVPGEQTAAQMQLAATQLYGQSLNSLGYGLSGSGGGNSYYDALISLLGEK